MKITDQIDKIMRGATLHVLSDVLYLHVIFQGSNVD